MAAHKTSTTLEHELTSSRTRLANLEKTNRLIEDKTTDLKQLLVRSEEIIG